MRRAVLAGAAFIGLAVGAPGTALAGGIVAFEGTVIVFTGVPTEAHSLDVGQGLDFVEFQEPGVVAGSACTQVAADRVRCPSGVATGIRITLGNLDDTLDMAKGVALPVEVFGLAGNDQLLTGVGNDTLRGGEGDDLLEPSPSVVPQPAGEANLLIGGEGSDTFELGTSYGADTVVGGDAQVPASLVTGNPANVEQAGTDTVDYSARPADRGGVAVGLGPGGALGVGTDGRHNGTEGDDLRQDVERVIGTAFPDRLFADACDSNAGGGITCFDPGSPPTLLGLGGEDELHGDDLDNVLLGGTEDDTLTGGRRDDTLNGGSGDDLLTGGSNSDPPRHERPRHAAGRRRLRRA